MSGRRIEKRNIPRWILLVAVYLCFVAELAFIIMGNSDYGIIFAGLCFCLVIVFFVLWREEQEHKRLILQSSLDEVRHREILRDSEKEQEQIKRLKKEREEIACGREQAQRTLEKLSQENEALRQLLEEAGRREQSISAREAVECILPSDEKPVELDLVTAAARAIAEMEDACRKSGIRLRLSCPNQTLYCRADERYIHLMIKNIIDNAIKYMRKSGSMVITLSCLGDNIFFAFKDDGMGLPQREMDHIFDLNFQGSNRAGGSGLGLAQVKAVVCRCGGTVYARSTDGMGIYIQLPVSGRPGDAMDGAEEKKAEETACESDGERSGKSGREGENPAGWE